MAEHVRAGVADAPGLVDRPGHLRRHRERGVPEAAQQRHRRRIPDDGRHDATGTCDPHHLADARDRVVHELHHKLREHDVELTVGERQVLAGADADVRARDASATDLGERLGGVDRGDMLGTDDAGDGGRQRAGATAHVEHARARADASDLDQAAGKLGPVVTDVAVVGLGGAGHDARASARGVAGD